MISLASLSKRAVKPVLLALFATITASHGSSEEISLLKTRLISELPKELEHAHDAEALSVWTGLGGTVGTKLAFLTNEACMPEVCYSHVFILSGIRTQYILSTYINFTEPFSKNDVGLALLDLAQKKWDSR